MTTNLGASFQVDLNRSEQDVDLSNGGMTSSATKPVRDSWGNKTEYILASIGFAVGLGNLWRFPYLCQKNGGGAFLIPYIIFMLIEGIPLMMLEFSIGQKMQMSSLKLWPTIHPALRGVGYACVIVSFLVSSYYIVVIAWCFYYMFISLQKILPWQGKELCPRYDIYQRQRELLNNKTYLTNETRRQLESKIANFSDCCVVDPPQWYFYSNVLQISTDIEDYSLGLNEKLVACLILTWIVVYLCVVKGIKSSGKVVYFTATFPYVILAILFFRGVTLEGAKSGLETFITPRWDSLNDPKIWKDAATQMFFTLGLGFGALVSFSSYSHYKNQCVRDTYVVVGINCGTSILAGIVVFSILGYRELKSGIKAAEVGSGPGLAFMAFSDAITQLDISPLWAFLFFFMLILLGIDSAFGLLEASISPIYELDVLSKRMSKPLFTAIVGVILFLIGLSMVAGNGFYIFQIFDDFSPTIPLLFIALFECIGVAWVYGNNRFADDIEDMTGKRPWIGWMTCWKYISPLAIIVLLIAILYDMGKAPLSYYAFVGCVQDPFSSKYPGSKAWLAPLEYPDWAKFLVALVIMASTIPIVLFLIIGWPKNWRTQFHQTFLTSLNNYHPDPHEERTSL